MVFKIINRNHSDIQGHFDLLPGDLKVNRDHLQVLTNYLVKYEN